MRFNDLDLSKACAHTYGGDGLTGEWLSLNCNSVAVPADVLSALISEPANGVQTERGIPHDRHHLPACVHPHTRNEIYDAKGKHGRRWMTCQLYKGI